MGVVELKLRFSGRVTLQLPSTAAVPSVEVSVQGFSSE